MEYPLQRLHLLCQISTLSYIDWVSSRPIRLFIVILMYNYWRYSHIYTGKCENYEFTCGNGKCLSKYRRCLGGNDCGDNSDEQQCRKCVFTNTSAYIAITFPLGWWLTVLLFKSACTYHVKIQTDTLFQSLHFFFTYQRNHNSNFNVDQIGKWFLFLLLLLLTT